MCVDLGEEDFGNDNYDGCFNPMPIIIFIFIIILMFKSCIKNENDPVKNFEKYMIEWKIDYNNQIKKNNK